VILLLVDMKHGFSIVFVIVLSLLACTLYAQDPIQQRILEVHNNARAKVHQAPLTWGNDAAAIASKYAALCKFEHNSNRGDNGENIFANAPGANPSPDLAGAGVGSWVNETVDYDCRSNTCKANKECGHYTQVVWGATTQVGCALQRCTINSPFGASFPTWNFLVCDYHPPGNYVGQRPFPATSC